MTACHQAGAHTSPPNSLTELSSEQVAEAAYTGIRTCSTTLRTDVLDAINAHASACQAEKPDSREASVLHSILHNAQIAQQEGMPLCQDTGSVWVCLEVGPDIVMRGNVLSQVDDAVACAYRDGGLRMSILADALFDRTNTQTNAPAFTELRFTEEPGCRLHIMLKGGGSDNASRIAMLAPGAGREGVKQVVLEAVREKAANACPPLIVGVGIGGTFDKVAGLSKHALLRRLDEPAESAEAAAFEEELMQEINALGIGPAALGGSITALGVHVKTAPCHIAALPVAVNLGCCAMRSVTLPLIDEQGNTIAHPWTYASDEEDGR